MSTRNLKATVIGRGTDRGTGKPTATVRVSFEACVIVPPLPLDKESDDPEEREEIRKARDAARKAQRASLGVVAVAALNAELNPAPAPAPRPARASMKKRG